MRKLGINLTVLNKKVFQISVNYIIQQFKYKVDFRLRKNYIEINQKTILSIMLSINKIIISLFELYNENLEKFW